MDIFNKIVFGNSGNNDYPTSDLFTIKPSNYMQEMLLTTEQRLEKIKRLFFKRKSKISEQLYIIPEVVVFQNFNQGEILTVPISVVNVSKTSCSLTFLFTNSPYFTMTYNDIVPNKLAPGMELQCHIHFNPESLKDCIHEIKVIATNKEYTVPIIAIGPRPILNLPDHIALPNSLVHIGIEKKINVQNVGKVPAIFNLHSVPPFFIKPASGILNSHECMQLTIQFRPEDEGLYNGTVTVEFDLGDTLVFTVQGTAECTDIVLTPKKVCFENTYVGLKCQRIIKIQNKSDNIIKFTWKKFNSNEEDKNEADKIKENLVVVREHETKRSTKLETFEVVDDDINCQIYKRIYDDEIIDFDRTEQFLYTDLNFSIIPEVGEIWPNHSADINLIFKPTEVRDFYSQAYCKVTGRVDRLPLDLYGTAIGPKFILNLDVIDLEIVYLFSQDNFEVVVCNNGDIPGTISFLNKEYDFGSEFFCNPATLELKPFEHGVFIVTLRPQKEGSFIEEIYFKISDSGKIIKIIVKGIVAYALLKANETSINFGCVSIGHRVEKVITLYNTTCIDIPFDCCVIPDGYNPTVPLNENLNSCVLPVNPKQYTCVPSHAVVGLKSSFDLIVQLIPCRSGKLSETHLCIDAWSCTKERLKIVVTYTGALPQLICTPSLVNIHFCFLNYLCERLIVIKNKTNYTGFVWFITETSDGLTISPDITETLIKPFGIIEVQLNIICTELGKQEGILKIRLFGGEDKTACQIRCIGQGPIVLINPDRIHFDNVTLLQVATKTILVVNDSPIPAEVNIQTKKNSPCTVNQTTLFLEAEESLPIEVSLYLNDNKKYKFKIFFDVLHRGIFECKVTAIGVGSAILIEPPMQPRLNLGPILTYTTVRKKFTVMNKGVRFHKIFISKSADVKKFFSDNDEKQIFSMQPSNFTLRPNESVELEVCGYHNKVEEIVQPFFFHALVENMEKKQIIVDSVIVVNFVEPQLQYSKQELLFRTDHLFNKTIDLLIDILEIRNISPLPLEADFMVKPPFFIEVDDKKFNRYFVSLEVAETRCLNFLFEPADTNNNCSVIKSIVDIKFRGHIKKDKLKISAQVNYPNIKFFPPNIDFGFIPPGSHSFYTVELRNVSPIKVAFKLEWSAEKSHITVAPDIKFKKKTPLSEKRCSESFMSSEPTIEIIQVTEKDDKKRGKRGKFKGKDKGSDRESEKEKEKEIKKGKKKDKSSVKSKATVAPKIKLLPVENIYLHYYTETYLYDSYILIFETLHEPVGIESLIGLSEETKTNLEQMKQFLFLSIEKFLDKDNIQTVLTCMDREPVKHDEIASVLNVIPIYGILEPFESQNLYISFYPEPGFSVNATLLCHILGGPTESLEITGESVDIHYELEATHVDFGRQVFSEIIEKKLTLKNTGLAPFKFITYGKEAGAVHSGHLLEAGCLTVHPRSHVVEPYSEIYLFLKYFPGIAGKFLETFELEIAHFPPITITVSGYGVFPQVFLNLARPSMIDVDVITCYEAIATISCDYLACVEHVQHWAYPEGEYFSTEIPKEERRILQRDGWSIITHNHQYPSMIDIELVVERALAYKQITQRQSVFLSKLRSGLGFSSPPYLADFGVVIIDTTVHYTVMVLNYGPSRVKVRLQKSSSKQLIDFGFDVQFKTMNIQVGETVPFYILFSPISDTYPERFYKVDYVIYLEVLHGLRIPLNIKAIVTKPFLVPSTFHINFNSVICGNTKSINLGITNKSLVTCNWKGNIEMKKRRNKPVDKLFHLKILRGCLNPDDRKVLEVTFEPNTHGIFNAMLIFQVEQNNEMFTVSLQGVSTLPILKFDKHELHFEPCVPYAPQSVQYFSIENPCDYPIEYVFSDFDKQILDEDKINLILCEYYGTDRVLTPERLPGAKIPRAFFEFGEDILKCIRNEPNDIVEPDVSVKKGKSKKKNSIAEIEVRDEDYFLNKSESFLMNAVREIVPSITTYGFEDPIAAAKIEIKGPIPEKNPYELKEGILFVFYGAPLTDFVYGANKMARDLKLPVYNLNDIIYEALAYNSSLCCLKINSIINDAYNIATLSASPEDEIKSEDPYVILQAKINFLLLPKKSKKGATKSGSLKTASRKSPVVDSSSTILGIQEELFIELLAQKLAEYKRGLVLETLKNNFIRRPLTTVMCLLQAVRNLKYIHFILSHDTLDNYMNMLKKKEQQRIINIETEKRNVLEYFDHIADEELDNLSPEDWVLYKDVYLAGRKDWLQGKEEALKAKHLETETNIPILKIAPISLSRAVSARLKFLPSPRIKSSASSGKSSTKSSPKSKRKRTATPKYSPEILQTRKDFEAYASTFDEITHICEYWDRTAGVLTKVYVPKVKKSAMKKGAVKKHANNLSFVSVEPLICDSPVGLPIWIIQDSQIEILPKIVQEYIEYQTASESLHKSLIDVFESTIETFTIIRKPTAVREQTTSKAFTLTTCTRNASIINHKLGSQDIDEDLNIFEKDHEITTTPISNTTMSDKVDIEPFKARDIIEPGEKKFYCVLFKTTDVKCFQFPVNIEVVSELKFKILCNAVCDMPRISMMPKIVFPMVINHRTSINQYTPNVYVRSEDTFDFGYKIVRTPPLEPKDYYRGETEINIRNISQVPCFINFHLRDVSETFRTAQDVMCLPSGETGLLMLSATPHVLGENINLLLIAIKDNPCIEVINLKCTGCKFDFEISKRKIQFERALKNHYDTKTITLSNKCAVPMNWKFLNCDSVTNSFVFDPESGFINPFMEIQLNILYLASKVEILPSKKLYLEVYEEKFEDKPLLETFLDISAETCDLLVNCSKNINIGQIKTKTIYHHNYEFLNDGKYNIIFEVESLYTEEVVAEIKKPVIDKVSLKPLTGVLIPQKRNTVDIIFSFPRSIRVKEFPIARCDLLDHVNRNVLSSFFICLTAKASYSKFDIFPTPNMDFGIMLVGSKSSQVLVITNTGNVEFSYKVLCKKSLDELQTRIIKKKTSEKSKKTSQIDKASKKTGKTKKSGKSTSKERRSGSGKESKSVRGGRPLPCGIYVCNNAKGTVAPKGKSELEIECTMQETGTREEMLIVFISECRPKDQLGKIVHLKATGHLPVVHYNNYESMFLEHFIVDKFEDFIKPREAETFCVFSKSNECLKFYNTCINIKAFGRIQIYNSGLVESVIQGKLSSSHEFKIRPQKLTLQSYSYGFFTIEFHPKEIKTYNAVLEFMTIMPDGYKSGVKTFHVTGDGRVPEITLNEPQAKNQVAGIYTMRYNPTLISKCSVKPIIIKNSGDFPCKVIIEICENNDEVFELQVKEDTVQLLNCKDANVSKYSNMIKLTAGDEGTFNLKYEPKLPGQYNCVIKIHVVNNPYETITINVNGKSFAEDIFIEDLPTQLDSVSLSNISDISLTNIYGSSYILDFDKIYPNILHKRKFKILNRSMEDIFKFVFRSSIPEVNFFPAVGHLKPSTHKIIIATFVSEIPVIYTKNFMDCLVCKIKYTDSVDILLSWDDRQKLVVRDENCPWKVPDIPHETESQPATEKESSELVKKDNLKETPLKDSMKAKSKLIWKDKQEKSEAEDKTNDHMLNEFPEPKYEVVDESIQRIPIFFSTLVDYPSYTCDTNYIKFVDTFMFDKRLSKFTIFNSGKVNLEINWNVILDKSSFKLSDVVPEHKTNTTNVKFVNYDAKTDHTPRPLSGRENFIDYHCKSANSLSAKSSEESFHISDKVYVPFTIIPEHTLIHPNQRTTYTIMFSPLDVFEYKANLKGIIQNAAPKEKDINVQVVARSLVPCCYFDVELSDYITSGRRVVKGCDNIDEANVKVVEMSCLGVGRHHTKTVNVVNPTDDELRFSWQRIKSYEVDAISIFDCNTTNGSIIKGKMLPIIFNVFPQSVGIFEALYHFKIEKYDIIVPFLFVANVRESDVKFLYSYMTLKPAVLGISVSDTAILKNNENIDLNYIFKKASLFSEGRKQSLAVQPLRGIVPKNGETKIKVSFNPNDVGEEAFTLVCSIEMSANPILLSVLTKCYEVQPILNCTISGKRHILNSDITNIFTFADMLVSNEEKANFIIANVGRIGFYYNWKYNDEFIERNFNFNISPKEGYIKINTEVNSLLTLKPVRNGTIRNFKLDFQVRYGPTYKILIHGFTSSATYKFSFMKYNFGPCVIQKSKIAYNLAVLEFFNGGNIPITLECGYLDTDHLSINFKIKVIPPKARQLIDICFFPRSIKNYSEEIVFSVNSQKNIIKILGEGVGLDIVLANITDKYIYLGSPQIGKTVSKTVKVINKSAATVQAIIDIWDRLPIVTTPVLTETHFLNIPVKKQIIKKEMPLSPRKNLKRKGGAKDKKSTATKSVIDDKIPDKASNKIRNEKKTSVKEESVTPKSVIEIESPAEIHRKLVKSMLTFSPIMPLTILPHKTAQFTIHYTPSTKIQPFSERVSVQICETVLPLCIVKGACVGPVFYLDRNEISFGAVVVQCVRQSKLILLNEGDVSSKVKWICNTKDFSIAPMEAYSSAGLSVTFVIKYHPLQLDIKSMYKAQCVLESYDKPLYVNLIGLCAKIPPATGIVTFSCPVRKVDVRSVQIFNTTNMDWKLYPQVTGDYFKCSDFLHVPAKDSVSCEIIYEPFRMTTNETHEGNIFIKRPDGEAIVFDLRGTASQPAAIQTRTLEFPCKTNHKEIFTVCNWSRFKQQFVVHSEDNTPDNTVNLYEIKGLATVEVPGQSEREYEWYIYVYKECFLDFNIIFMNDEKEFMYYHLLMKVGKCKPLETINLQTCVRVSVQYNLMLINPLSEEVTYRVTSNSSYLSFTNSVTVKPNTEVTEIVTYNPLQPEQVSVLLDATCQQLGTYLYEFLLDASPAAPEEPTYFSTVLGETKMEVVHIQNMNKGKTSFVSQIEKDEESFSLEQFFQVSAGQTVPVRITFTPIKIGTVETVLKLTSNVAGEYIFPLIGKCGMPTPKGPFNISPKTNVTFNFFNPFLYDEVFVCNVEPNVFVLNSVEEFIKSKTNKQITISLTDSTHSKYPVVGKLVIFSKNTSVKWIYYLNGVNP